VGRSREWSPCWPACRQAGHLITAARACLPCLLRGRRQAGPGPDYGSANATACLARPRRRLSKRKDGQTADGDQLADFLNR
jgi:hypothetical protein